MTVNELKVRLGEFPPDGTVSINYPNDDQSWPPFINIWKDGNIIGEIEVDPDVDVGSTTL